MHKIFGLLSVVLGGLGALLVSYLIYGLLTHDPNTPAKIALHVFRLYGFIFSVFGLGLGLMSRFLAHRHNQPPHGVTAIAIGVSMFSLMALLLGLTVS